MCVWYKDYKGLRRVDWLEKPNGTTIRAAKKTMYVLTNVISSSLSIERLSVALIPALERLWTQVGPHIIFDCSPVDVFLLDAAVTAVP